MHRALTASQPSWWRSASFRIAAIYALAGVLWILFSDQLLAALVLDPATLTRLQTLKGWFYILLTAGLLHSLIEGHIATLRR